jgi:uncharacterized protein YijF (DUF1287 family)
MANKEQKRGRGRPTKELTEEKAFAIVQAVSAGANRIAAAKCAGICHETLRKWLADNKEFRERVECADATARVMAEQRIFLSRDWKAQLAWLQSKYPTEWGLRQRIEHANPEGEAFKTEANGTTLNVTPEDLSKYDASELARMYKDSLGKPEAS